MPVVINPVKFWCNHCERNSYQCGNCGLNACSGGSNCEHCESAYQAEQAMTPEEILSKEVYNE